MDTQERNKLIKVARKYYEEDCMQGDIAAELNISRPQVSRLLKKAKELGIVKINIVDPWNSLRDMENRIMQYFNLKRVIIVEVENGSTMQQQLGYAASQFLSEILKDNDIIGISWGTTLYQMVSQMTVLKKNNIKVVQIKGGAVQKNQEINSFDIASTLARKLGAELFYLPIPVLLETPKIKELICNEASIKEIMKLGQEANVALYSIGYTGKNATVAKSGYLTKEDIEEMHASGAVGDICSRFFTYDGQVYDEALNDRTTSIDLEGLKNKEYAIGISGGEAKKEAIIGALRGGYLNTLITDKVIGEALIEYIETNKKC